MLDAPPNTRAIEFLRMGAFGITAVFDRPSLLTVWVLASLLRLTPPPGSHYVPGKRYMTLRVVLSRFTRNLRSISAI
jgi:hypothetical protein